MLRLQVFLALTCLMLGSTAVHARPAWTWYSITKYLDNVWTNVWKYPGRTCQSEACKNLAKQTLSWMDAKADPCEDFFRYSCGNWKPGDLLAVNDVTDVILKRRLSSRNFSHSDMVDTKMHNLYAQCLAQEEQSQKLTTTQLISLLNDTIGGWPILTPNWDPNDFDLPGSLAKLRMLGFEPLFTLSVIDDPTSTIKKQISLSAPKLFHSEYLRRNSLLRFLGSYVEYMKNITTLLHNSSTPELPNNTTADLNKAFRLAFALQQFASSSQKLGHRKKAAELSLNAFSSQMFYKSELAMEFKEYLKSVFASVNLNHLITGDTVLSSPDMDYFMMLDDKLKNLADSNFNESQRTIANVIGWQVMSQILDYLPAPFKELSRAFDQIILQKPMPANDSRTEESCLKLVRSLFPKTIRNTGNKHSPQKSAKHQRFSETFLGSLMEDLRIIYPFATTLDEVPGRSSGGKNASQDIVANTWQLISDLDEPVDENVTVQATFYATQQHILARATKRTLLTLGDFSARSTSATVTDHLPTGASRTRVASNDIRRTVYVPHAILEPYDESIPFSVLYATIGVSVATEMIRAYHVEDFASSSLVDIWGNFRETPIDDRNPASDESTISRVSSNTVDNGGLPFAYRAFELYYGRQRTMGQRLPGLENFTQTQMFYVITTQRWCEKLSNKDRPEWLQDLRFTGIAAGGWMGAQMAFQCPYQTRWEFTHPFKLRNESRTPARS